MNKGRGPGRGPAFAKPKEKTSVVLLKLWRYLAKYQWIIVSASLLSILGNALGLLSPRLSGAAIDAIELFDGGLADLCDVTVAITAPEEDRIQRLLARDGISYEHAALRIRAQKPESYFREKCDYVLENNGTQAEFQEKCLAFFREFIIMK